MYYNNTCQRCGGGFTTVARPRNLCRNCEFKMLTTPTLMPQRRSSTAPAGVSSPTLKFIDSIEEIKKEEAKKEIVVPPLSIPWMWYVNIAMLILLLVLITVR